MAAPRLAYDQTAKGAIRFPWRGTTPTVAGELAGHVGVKAKPTGGLKAGLDAACRGVERRARAETDCRSTHGTRSEPASRPQGGICFTRP
jgi:hypothetical protein